MSLSTKSNVIDPTINDTYFKNKINEDYYNAEIRKEYHDWLISKNRHVEASRVVDTPRKASKPIRLKMSKFESLKTKEVNSWPTKQRHSFKTIFDNSTLTSSKVCNFASLSESIKNHPIFDDQGVEFDLKETTVIRFENAYLTCNGAFFTDNNRFFNDNRVGHGAFLRGAYYDSKYGWHKDGEEEYSSFSGPLLVVQKHPMINYYHFLIEQAPNLVLFNELKKDVPNLKIFLVENKFNDLFFRVAELFDVPRDDFVISKAPLNKIEDCFRPSYSDLRETGSFLTSKLEDFSSQLIVKAASKSSKEDYSKYIYISRSDAGGKREIENEVLLNELFDSFGIKTVTLTGVSIIEQINIFRNADLVIGAHGAGLSNVIFCSEGTNVIEITKTHTLNRLRIFWDISTLKNANFHVICSDDDVEDHSSGFQVDIEKIDSLLKKLVKNKEAQ